MAQLLSFIQGNQNKPNRLLDKKDVKYHIDYGRYALWAGWDYRHNLFLQQYYINKCFFADNQWIFEEDLEAFLKGTSSQQRNRIKQTFNEIRPLVNQYVGNCAAMDITMEARALSSKAINRREKKLGELMFMTEVSMMASDDLSQHMRETMPIGNTPKETEELFENIYVDNYVEQMNSLIAFSAETNKFKEMQKILALDMCLSGKATMEYYIHNGELRFMRVDPEQFGFDRTAQEWDLSDADFQFKYDYMSPAIIFERWQGLTTAQREAIEKQSISNENSYVNNGAIPVVTVYFRDSMVYSYGYVIDEFGYPYLTRINFTYEGEEKPRYTEADLIPYEKLNFSQRRILKEKEKKDMYVDVMRFVQFIPKEVVPCNIVVEGNSISDIVLDYGIYPYQDTELEKVSNVSYPFKTGIWVYMDGYTYTPISSLIAPQRMINRVASVTDNLINNAKPETIFYDGSAVSDEAQFLNDFYQGKPVRVDARRMGIQGIVTTQGRLLDSSIAAYNQMQSVWGDRMSKMMGINEALMGTSIGQHQLAGVTQMQEERASVIQEPYYSAIISVYKQAAQTICNVGKRLYIQNERELSIIVGDKNVKTVVLSKDLNNEDFRVFIERVPSRQKQIAEGDAAVIQLWQAQAIPELKAADLFGRSTKEQVGRAWRESSKEKIIIEQKQAEAQQQALAQAQQQLQGKQDADRMSQAEQQDIMLKQKDLDREHDLDKEVLKGMNKAQATKQVVPLQ